MKFTHDFVKDFDAIVNEREPFAFVRFHDGEHAILNGLPYRAASKWTSRGNDVWFKDELFEVLKCDVDGFYLGISPPCCTPQAAEYYRRFAAVEKTTFATIFQAQNYKRWRALRKRFNNAVLIGSGACDIVVPANGVSQKWEIDAVVSQMLGIDKPFLVAAGPCANIIIYRYWAQQEYSKRQTAIDVGAALDQEIHKVPTRPYHKAGSKAQLHGCKWDKWAPFAKLSEDRNEDPRVRAQNTYAKLAAADKPESFATPNVRRVTSKDGRYSFRDGPKNTIVKKTSRPR